MKKLKIELEHCYGIKKLSTEFEFTENKSVFAIYAPNGLMKTSLANTFKDISEGRESSDRIWKGNETIRKITDENGEDLTPESIFVIEPYKEKYRSDHIFTLLANDILRKQYEDIYKEIGEKTDTLVANLKKISGLKKDIEEELSNSITHDPNSFLTALGRVREEVESGTETPLGDVTYTDIFNPKVKPVLEDPHFKGKIDEYILKYNELLSQSTFFKKGVFTHNNAAAIATSLHKNGFFGASHSVYLCIKGKKTEISSLKELEAAIEVEKNQILTDAELKKAFEKIDKQLTKNADLVKFRKCLEDNQIVLAELTNIDRLRQNLWIEYLTRSMESFRALLSAHDESKSKLAKIVEKAKKESTKWADVIHIFNERFSVPFVVRIDNQEDVILKKETPTIDFNFLENLNDRNSAATKVEEDDLIKVLSNGEQRALYLLNIIFEVEARKESGQQTLFIVDDIADSFDYKNKYAIVEYLKEMGEEPLFQKILLSHNFDFYRTVCGRLRLRRENRMHVSKENGAIHFQKEIYQKSDPFSDWRNNLKNDSKLIASIPFLRNLAGFSGDHDSYKKLTSLLHIKDDTDKFKVSDLEDLIKKILHDQKTLTLDNPEAIVKNLAYEVAENFSQETSETSSLEKKVAISIAIRLKAEEFMIAKINDDAFWRRITSYQTTTLIQRFKENYPGERENIQLLDQVNLMTPENIHLNSFMYEPILDMSSQHLKTLFKKISKIQ